MPTKLELAGNPFAIPRTHPQIHAKFPHCPKIREGHAPSYTHKYVASQSSLKEKPLG